jgi:hypothetical protein
LYDACFNYLEEDYSMLKLASLLITFLLIAVMPTLADIRGTDATGKAVILRSDGTWSYIVIGGGSGNLDLSLSKPCAANRVFVTSLYQSILNRQPDAGGLNYWTGRLNSGQTKKWLIAQLFKSREYTGSRKSNREFVRDAYQAILGRQPEPAGHSSWIRQLGNSLPRVSLVQNLLRSIEYTRIMARCGTGSTSTGWISYCKRYADQALRQQNVNLNRGCNYTGVRWHLDYNRHNNWCLNADAAGRRREAKARADAIARCVARPTGGKTTYLGCFVDKPDRDIKGYSFGSGQMTNQLCINTCRTKGFGIAATQFSSQCFCGNSSGKYGRAPNANECKYPCKGNDKTNCGGYWRNSVYKIGAGTLPPPPPPQNQRIFNNPKWKGHIVDNCVTWATTCDGGGANNFCRKKGYNKASKWTHSRPGTTYVIGSNRVCRGGFCVGYSSITCTR